MITNKQLDKIIELFCIVDPRKYPDGTGIWGMDTEIYSKDLDKSALEKAREAIRKILNEGGECKPL